jgi:FtsZ-binding cell division protein ZapB
MAYDQVTADVIAENNLLRYQIAVLKDEITILKGERDRLKLWQEDVQNSEAAVCPEDVGFDEYIRALKGVIEDVARLQATHAEALGLIDTSSVLRCYAPDDILPAIATLKADLSKANTKIEQLIEQLHAATEDYANAKADAAQVRSHLQRIAVLGPEENARLTKYGFVFNRPIGVPLPDDEAGRWEMLAFTLHSDVWEAASIAQSILDDDEGALAAPETRP